MKKRLSKKKQALYIRRIIFVIAIIVVAILQNTPHLFPSIFGARAFLLIPLVVCFGMFETDLVAALLGGFAGALWDVTLAAGDGYNALILMCFATVTSLLINYVMRNNISTALLISGVAIVLYSLLHWFIFVVCSGATGGIVTLFSFYLPSTIYTFIFAPVFYTILRWVLRKIKE